MKVGDYYYRPDNQKYYRVRDVNVSDNSCEIVGVSDYSDVRNMHKDDILNKIYIATEFSTHPDHCFHSYVEYTGLLFTDFYCSRCGKKKDEK